MIMIVEVEKGLSEGSFFLIILVRLWKSQKPSKEECHHTAILRLCSCLTGKGKMPEKVCKEYMFNYDRHCNLRLILWFCFCNWISDLNNPVRVHYYHGIFFVRHIRFNRNGCVVGLNTLWFSIFNGFLIYKMLF